MIVIIALTSLVALWVMRDARNRGRAADEAWLWGMGVFLALIVFLPAYFYFRSRTKGGVSTAQTTCRYCGATNEGDPDYCPRCSNQLKGAETIHRK